MNRIEQAGLFPDLLVQFESGLEAEFFFDGQKPEAVHGIEALGADFIKNLGRSGLKIKIRYGQPSLVQLGQGHFDPPQAYLFA